MPAPRRALDAQNRAGHRAQASNVRLDHQPQVGNWQKAQGFRDGCAGGLHEAAVQLAKHLYSTH
jgi:hypothetical protein